MFSNAHGIHQDANLIKFLNPKQDEYKKTHL